MEVVLDLRSTASTWKMEGHRVTSVVDALTTPVGSFGFSGCSSIGFFWL